MVKYIVRLTLGTLKNGCYREVAVVGLVAARGDSTVYHRIYCRKCLTLSNKTSHYIRRCISILFIFAHLEQILEHFCPISRCA